MTLSHFSSHLKFTTKRYWRFRLVIIASLVSLLVFFIWTTTINYTSVLPPCSLSKELRFNAYLPQKTNKTYNIGILVIFDHPDTEKDFKVAKDSLVCYANLQKYALEFVYFNGSADLARRCPHKDKYDWTLFLDADIGVINPNHRIEEYIDDTVDLIFYDRFYNWEVTAGSYLAKNSNYSAYFLNEWANFEYRLPNSFHGTDNGVLHMILIEQLAPVATIERGLCERWLNNSVTFTDLFTFEACARMTIGANRYWPGKLKILRKGRGWSRDGWITDTKFCASDFMFHGWKLSKLDGEWPMPFVRPDDLTTCKMGYDAFATFSKYNVSIDEIEDLMCRKYVDVEKVFLSRVNRISNLL